MQRPARRMKGRPAAGGIDNPWGVQFLRMFDMTNDAGLFRTRAELESQGFRLEGNVFVKGRERFLPLYEAKMVHQFDHRFATYDDAGTDTREVTDAEKADPEHVVLPRYWVPQAEVEARLAARGWHRGWLLGWRDIARSTDERTVIAAVIPRVGVGNNFPLMLPTDPPHAALLVATMNALIFDYCARQKVGGPHLNYFLMKQFPFLPPSAFDRPLFFDWPAEPGRTPATVGDFVRSRVLELVYTARDLAPFARDLGHDGPPFRWDPERRFRLRCELDALFFHLYLPAEPDGSWRRATREWAPVEETPGAFEALTSLFPKPRDAVSYILDQFPIVRRRDEERFGEYRTRRAVLELYDEMLRRHR